MEQWFKYEKQKSETRRPTTEGGGEGKDEGKEDLAEIIK